MGRYTDHAKGTQDAAQTVDPTWLEIPSAVAIKNIHASGAAPTRRTWDAISITCRASPDGRSRAKGMVASTMAKGAAHAANPGWQIIERNAARGRLSRTIRKAGWACH